MRYYRTLSTRQAGWMAAVVFTTVGALLVWGLPAAFAGTDDAALGFWIGQLLGGAFLFFGIGSFVWMIGDTILGMRGSAWREKWLWWGNFLLGSAGALVFAIPATLILPMMLWYPYLFGEGNTLDNLWLGALFTFLGVLTLIGYFYMARWRLKGRPR